MRKLLKDSEGNVVELLSVNGDFMPEGFEEVASEDLADAELGLARNSKLAQIRAKRNALLIQNDKLWMIASKKGESTTDLETDAQTLRDLPELAQSELEALEDAEAVKAYDCFTGLVLHGSYE